ncbi:MAG: hypothetical protein PHU21_09520 [Elusimicrobia bacterium]|nr:hypothetical protein [Elusimicrobiota bacterium]
MKVISRNTQGVRLVKLDEGDKVGHVAALLLAPAQPAAAAPAAPPPAQEPKKEA